MNEIATQLFELPTREAGYALLRTKFMTKKELVVLARLLHLPIQNYDTKNTLQDKIVENTIGFRLNWKAIVGE